MAKYHVNKKGEAGLCKASVKACPLGGEETHGEFADATEAARWAEEKLASEFAKPALRKDAMNAMAASLAYDPENKEQKLTGEKIASLTHDEWKSLAQSYAVVTDRLKQEHTAFRDKATNLLFPEGVGQDKPYAGYDPGVDAQVKALRAQEEKARIALNSAGNVKMFASLAQTLTSKRVIKGTNVPPGHAEMPIIYDLEGNPLAAERDTRTSGQNVTLPTGEKAVFRASQSKDPEKKRATEAAKGFVVGKGIIPVELKQNTRGHVKVTPDYGKLRAGKAAIVATEFELPKL